MGWWWGHPKDNNNVEQEDGSIERTVRPTGKQDRTQEILPKLQAGRDQQAYEEFKKMLDEIDPEAVGHTNDERQPHPDMSDSIYPSTMSCSQCFDQAFYCSSIGGQLNNVYRYGALRSCSDLWRQWRFCMRTKAMSEETKQIKIREFNQQKAVKYKVGPSSEDVWEVRKEPFQQAFAVDSTS